jgi:hypothetical protein
MTTPPRFPILLDLGDGRGLIPCRDGRQADLLLSLWRSWQSVGADDPAPGLQRADTSGHDRGRAR